MGYSIAIDAGGTFTDVVVACPDGRILIDKFGTVPERMFDAAKVALKRIDEQLAPWGAIRVSGSSPASSAGTEGSGAGA